MTRGHGEGETGRKGQAGVHVDGIRGGDGGASRSEGRMGTRIHESQGMGIGEWGAVGQGQGGGEVFAAAISPIGTGTAGVAQSTTGPDLGKYLAPT